MDHSTAIIVGVLAAVLFGIQLARTPSLFMFDLLDRIFFKAFQAPQGRR